MQLIMSKRNSKFEVGDVVYIPEFGGCIPIISEETIVNILHVLTHSDGTTILDVSIIMIAIFQMCNLS